LRELSLQFTGDFKCAVRRTIVDHRQLDLPAENVGQVEDLQDLPAEKALDVVNR
jgi:hypothetical protein